MMKKKWMALALAGLVWMGGSAMAMDVHVDSSTEGMKDKVASIPLDVQVKTPLINQISNVVYEQVPMRGYPNVAMKMDILQPKSDKNCRPLYTSPAADSSMRTRITVSSSGCTWRRRGMWYRPLNTG